MQMHLRQRYQYGCLTRKKRTRGEDVWEFRYYEMTSTGQQRLRSLQLAPKTRSHIRGLMHLLYQHAIRWELTSLNPISLVRQGSRRLGIPRVLTSDEIRSLLAELIEPYRTMVLVAVCLGLR